MNEPSDDELLARSRLRPEVLGLLYERHAPAVFRFLARRAGPAAAEDLLGDVFVAAVDARTRYRPHPSGSALPWLYGIGANVVRAHLRRRISGSMVDAEAGVDWDAVDDRLDARAAREQLRVALARLTSAEREAFLLVAWEGLSVTEAAEVIGATPTAVRARVSRARRRARGVVSPAAHPAEVPVV